ncbi:MAG: YceI family protein [Gammaproteobacteria bacterium]|jgi:polyisoprenoid-binding protein YceI|nr:YceI family protein [Gammaproteobacteria bacterium]MBU0829635.1 YceI family protein [Gammaproteobacteria bacterium]MBU0892452.1 YceI family protein [Gammaproteobacteria bacterium]MBU1352330.1 YceI family protein [Gammaproteobacteria bacterium]MBU1508203.1 YceI family protein [Gammaproteobacteria bacterium]
MRKSLVSLFAVAAATAMTAGAAQAATYAIDPTHTFVTFEISHFGATTNRGRFDKKQGTVEFDRAAKTGKVDITIDTTSVNTGTPPFDKHLQSADLFDAAKHPTIKFVSDKFSFNGDKVSEVTGQLTLLGKTAPITLKATQFNCYDSPMLKREVCGGDFEATIDRTQWGMNYGVEWGFPKNVRLVVQIEAVKQ